VGVHTWYSSLIKTAMLPSEESVMSKSVKRNAKFEVVDVKTAKQQRMKRQQVRNQKTMWSAM
jgi:hypothetical protein